MGWGEGRLLFLGSSTWNWNYRFRNKARVLAHSRSGYKYPSSSCTVWRGAQGQREAWHGTGVTPDGGGGGSHPGQGVGCFPALMASAAVETPVTRLLAGTGCPLRLPTPFLQLHSWPLCDSGPSWSLSQLGVESPSSIGSRRLSDALRCKVGGEGRGGLEIKVGEVAWPRVRSS